MDGSLPLNTYLAGNFAPVQTEDDFELEVVGRIPAELKGTFFRNGPNPQFTPPGEYHWFGGDGMIHAFVLERGRARYRNRYVRTNKYVTEHEAGRALFGTFGNPMTTDASVMGQDSGVANTNILPHAGRLFALEEGHMPTELDPHTLETIGYDQAYRGKVTAHPKIDAVTGEMIWFGYATGQAPFNATVSYGVTNAAGEVVRRDDFEAPYAAMVHDFLITERHVLFPILPLTASLTRAMSGQSPFAWEPEKGAYVGVMARNASVDTLRWVEVDPCYVFHPMNAWEEGGKIFADVMQYPVAPLFPNADGTRGARTHATLTRWTIDLEDGSDRVAVEQIDDLSGDFPRFDERYAGRAYRHGWFAAQERNVGGTLFDAIAHVDLETRRRTVHALPLGEFTGEPIFVPRSPEAAEGDGWVLAVVHKDDEDCSELRIFKATDIGAGPIAIARVPRRVPYGFHGNWMAAA